MSSPRACGLSSPLIFATIGIIAVCLLAGCSTILHVEPKEAAPLPVASVPSGAVAVLGSITVISDSELKVTKHTETEQRVSLKYALKDTGLFALVTDVPPERSKGVILDIRLREYAAYPGHTARAILIGATFLLAAPFVSFTIEYDEAIIITAHRWDGASHEFVGDARGRLTTSLAGLSSERALIDIVHQRALRAAMADMLNHTEYFSANP